MDNHYKDIGETLFDMGPLSTSQDKPSKKDKLRQGKKWFDKLVRRTNKQTNEQRSELFNPQNIAYWVLIAIFFIFYTHHVFSSPEKKNAVTRSLEILKDSLPQNPDIGFEQRLYDKLLPKIKNANDFEHIALLTGFLEMCPRALSEIPSTMPLKKKESILSSPYGERYHPVHKTTKNHYGLDLAAKKGTPLFATAKGVVIVSEDRKGGYGKHIVIDHQNGFKTLYGHLSERFAMVGDTVAPHQFIGQVGSTGISTGPHLHYEILKNGRPIDPAPFFNLKYSVIKKKFNL